MEKHKSRLNTREFGDLIGRHRTTASHKMDDLAAELGIPISVTGYKGKTIHVDDAARYLQSTIRTPEAYRETE